MQWLLIICLFVLAGHRVDSATILSQPCPPGQERHGSECISQGDSKETGKDQVLQQSLPENAECLPKSKWESNCYSCECSDSGFANCVKQNDCLTENALAEPVRCQLNSTFSRDCNTCVCLENGLILCTLQNCRRDPSKSEVLSGKKCAPGSSWRSQCNTCNCNNDGIAICTLALCVGQQEPEMICAPKTTWMNSCNTCRCTSDGKPICTKMGCLSSGKTEMGCVPNTTWKDSCNTCWCTRDGNAMCTRMECIVSSKPEMECVPNTTWKDSCNSCYCTSDGRAMCTRKECFGYIKPEMECVPNTTWKDSCNTCWCTSDGKSTCTRVECFGSNKPETRCVPNTTWKDSCNTCHCTSNGATMCTLMECYGFINDGDREKNLRPTSDLKPGQFQEVKRPSRAVRCIPSEVFQLECNTCKCSQSGQSYTCTQKECFVDDPNSDVDVFIVNTDGDYMESHTVCKPRDTFYVTCNTCHCNDFGTEYACTNKPCPLPKDVEVFHELNVTRSSKNATKSVVCVANRMFIKDCNTCWCNDDGTSFYCTRRICVPMLPDEVDTQDPAAEKLREIKKECKPDEVFELDCNMCRCNPDGKSFSCTRRACVEEDKNKPLSRQVRALQQADLPKACEPGQEFRMDCNKCLCDNEGKNFSCTRIDCSALNNNSRKKREVTKQETKKCVPGSVFDQGCNVCRCTDEGHHATCTLKRCHQENEVDLKAPEQDPGFRCNAGEQFTRDCNDCTCSADGKSIFCTIRLCDQQLTPDI